jgi:PAS domain S-box-containing protein
MDRIVANALPSPDSRVEGDPGFSGPPVPELLAGLGAPILQTLIDSMPDPAFVKARDGRYLLVNAALVRALGLVPGAIVGRNDLSLFPEQVAQRVMANDQVAIAMGRAEQFHEALPFLGASRTYIVTRNPFCAAGGGVAGLVCTLKDVDAIQLTESAETERLTGTIRMQEAIAEASMGPGEVMSRVVARTMELLGGSGATVFLAEDDQLVCRAAAGSVAPMLGEPVAISTSLVGRAYLESAALRCRDAQTDARVDGALYRRLGIRSGIIVPVRSDLRTIGVLSVVHHEPNRFSEGEFQSLILIGGLLSGAIARARTFARNRELVMKLTEALHALSANEERFRSAVDAAGLAVWDWQLQTGELAWLGHYEAVLGIADPRECRRLDGYIALVHPDDRLEVEQAIRRALSSNAEYSHTHRIVVPDGRVRWIMARGEFHHAEDGSAVRMVGAMMDVTERLQLESQVLQSQKIEAIGQLAAGIAHEINTPIQYVTDNLRFLEESFRGILGLVEAVRRGSTAAEIDALWQRMDGDFVVGQIPLAASQGLEGAERVANIVRAMKEFAHPGMEEMRAIDLNHAVSNTAAVSRSEWRYVAELELDLDPALPLLPCNQGEIQQVILNLIVNAAHAIADAGRSGHGRIVVSTRATEEWCEIKVRDDGTGIPEVARPRVFDPFFTTKEVGRGTGQGLSLAHDTVVKKHRGSLDFETEMGVGTTFTIRLPWQQPEQAET